MGGEERRGGEVEEGEFTPIWWNNKWLCVCMCVSKYTRLVAGNTLVRLGTPVTTHIRQVLVPSPSLKAGGGSFLTLMADMWSSRYTAGLIAAAHRIW